MATFDKATMRRTIVFLIVAATTLVFTMSGCSAARKSKKNEKKTEAPRYTVYGRDPMEFGDAAAMYTPAGRKLLDDLTAKAILSDIDTSAKEGDPWSPRLCAHLERLRGARISRESIVEFRNAANRIVIPDRAPSRSKIATAKQHFDRGNAQYEAGRFDKAIESYRMALTDHSAYWDAWNNMALAEMHDNNHMIALFLLSALTNNNPKYAGGFINLSVCLERLGQNTTAYDIAAAVALNEPKMPMAHYNLAWFENSRGKYESANDCLSKALESVPDYAPAKWLQTINSMESGRSITADELKALPTGDQSQGIPKIVSKPVILATADAYSGNAVVAKIPKGSKLVISGKAGDWYAFYWPVEEVKRRLWAHQASIGDMIDTTSNDLKAFLGTWTGKWGDVTEKSIKIEEVDGRPRVSMYKDTASDEKLDNGRLSFRVKIKASGWEFVYTLKPVSGGLELDVLRLKDSKRFSGKLSK